MNAEEIMHALRQTAMGRVNTPEQHRLCEALAKLLERSRIAEAVTYTDEGPIKVVVTPEPDAVIASDVMPTVVIKRGPGRPKKAE